MQITWYGQSCFKIITQKEVAAGGQIVLVLDPFDKSIGLTPPRFKADLILVSHEHYDHNSIAGEPNILRGPGEYEIGGINILGIDASHGLIGPRITIYTIEAEDMVLGFLSDLGEPKLRSDQIKLLEDLDILFVPIGGKYKLGNEELTTLDTDEAINLATQLEPKILIPMHYKVSGLNLNLASPEKFMKNFGVKDADLVDKLTIKKKDLPQEEMKVVMFKLATGQ